MTTALLLLLFAAPDPPARARVEVTPKDGAWVGQRVTLAVTLATPGLFAGAPSFDIPPIPGAVILPPAGSPVVGSETVGDTTFTTQRHEFAVYAQRPGVVRIPAFAVRFESNAGFGKPTVQRRVTTEAVSFAAKTPPGADGLGTVVAARDLKVSEGWDPGPKTPKVGDAFTRTVTVTAADVPGMVFPPFRFGPIDGLAAYPKPPAVTDRTERGELTGRRVESVTYVCERAGAVAIPDRTLTWFDLDGRALKTEKLPGRTFDVAPDPKAAPAPADAPAPPPRTSHWWWAVAAGAAATLAVRVWPRWVRYRAARAESEPAAFGRFRRACHSADPHAVFTAMLAWLDRLGPMTLDDFAARSGDADLARAARDLQNRVYARPGPGAGNGWLARELFARAVVARRRLRAAARPAAGSLPPLNPTG